MLDTPSGQVTNLSAIVAGEVRACIARQRFKVNDLTAVLHCSPSTARELRLGRREWTFPRVEQAANWLRVPPESLLLPESKPAASEVAA
jgi:hypothetical protein